MTVALWFKNDHTGLSSDSFHFAHGESFSSPNVIGFFDNYSNNTTYFYVRTTGSGVTVWTTKPYTTKKWCHLAFVFDFDTTNSTCVAKCYVNGVLEQTRNITNTQPNYTTENMLFQQNFQVNETKISDFRIYATALSADDIKQLYSSPIAIDNQGKLHCSEIVENAKYPSKYWHTPSYAEMNYLLNTRTNASNLRTLGSVNVNGTYVNGCFLLPDDWVLPAGVTMTITMANYTTNSYSLEDFVKFEDSGVIFLPFNYCRDNISFNSYCSYVLGSSSSADSKQDIAFRSPDNIQDKFVFPDTSQKCVGSSVRLCRSSQDSHSFSTSATSSIKFANGNVQYHCTQHKWRFAEHQYDYIGADNANISDSYNGWIDLFGYGTSGVNYSPTLHTTNNADYASGDITNTDNDWGINEIIENDTLGMSEGIITAKEFKEI